MMLAQEVLVAVDERDANSKGKRAKMLRAMDVLPPFNQKAPREAQDGNEADQAGHASTGAQGRGADAADSEERTAVTGPPPADPEEIPQYDLAEHILAEQRRMASRRRRGPGRPGEGEPAGPCEEPIARIAALEPSPQDLAELQRMVAEIVARDIERLCKRPDQQPRTEL